MMNMTVKSIFTLAAAAAAMMSASCSKDGGRAEAGDLQLRLSTGKILAGTRASGEGLQLTQFASGKKVDIFLAENVDGTATTSGSGVTSYEQPLSYTADGSGGLTLYSEDGGSSATIVPQYWPASGKGLFIYGVYPSGAASSISGTATFTVQADQSSPDGYNASDLMTGAPSQNPATRTASYAVKLNFTHRLTKVDISLTEGDGFTSGDLASAKVYIVNTLPSVTFSADGATFGEAQGSATDILVCSSGTEGSAIIVPQTVTSGTGFIKVAVGGGSYVYKLASGVTFEGGRAYTYSIKVNKTGLSVASDIAAWTSGGTSGGSATLE